MDHKRHVMALYELANTHQSLDDVLTSLERVESQLSDTLIAYFDSPLVALADKEKLVDSFALDTLTRAWFNILLKEKMMHHFHRFYQTMIQHIRAINREVHVDVYVAKNISNDVNKKLTDALRLYFDSDVVYTHIHVDETLIGGMRLMYQGQSLDQTILSMLEELQTVI